jgi:hypothetical protein
VTLSAPRKDSGHAAQTARGTTGEARIETATTMAKAIASDIAGRGEKRLDMTVASGLRREGAQR